MWCSVNPALREQRRAFGLHRDFLAAHRGNLLDKPLNVTDVLSATCSMSRH
jgi:hypothetical protein